MDTPDTAVPAGPAAAPPRSMVPPLVAFAALAIVLAYVEAIHGFLATVAFSALAAILCRWLQLTLLRRGIGRKLAVTITVLAYVVVLGLLAAAAIASVFAVVSGLSGQADELRVRFDELALAFGNATGLPPDSVPSISPEDIISGARQLLSTVTPAITGLAMSVLIVTYVLLDADNLRRRMLRATSSEVVARYTAYAEELVVYIRVRAVLGAAAAIADTVLLLVLGVPYAVLWGVVSFLFSFVPNLGFILALIPPTVFAFLELGPLPALAVVIGYVVINLAFDYVLQPRMMSANLDLSPVIVIVSILFWTVVIGPVGALLAVPLTMVTRVLLVPFESTRWFVALLGPVPEEDVVPGEPEPEVVVPGPAAEPTIER
ncbi:MAG TPA: AI-2E family transporter [Candidatus Limnocylindrales bacterium]|nr:AI-2E family transporter [Candidatus Limnocylindrales bacterium]